MDTSMKLQAEDASAWSAGQVEAALYPRKRTSQTNGYPFYPNSQFELTYVCDWGKCCSANEPMDLGVVKMIGLAISCSLCDRAFVKVVLRC